MNLNPSFSAVNWRHIEKQDGYWRCPHCSKKFPTGKRHYHKYHYNNRCNGESPASSQQQQQSRQPDSSRDHTGLDVEDNDFDAEDEQTAGFEGVAAAYIRETREQEAELQQQLVQTGISPEQQLQVQRILQQLQLDAAQRMQAVQAMQQQQEQQDAHEEEEEPDAAAAAAFLRKAEDLRRERHRPLYEGSELNALAGMFMVFEWRHRNNVKDRACDELLEILHTSLLPKGNRMPGSLYLLRKILNVKRPCDYEHHACKCEKHYWKSRPRKEWSMTSDRSCPHCGENRFQELQVSGGRKKLKPAGRVFYYIHPSELVQELHYIPAFAQARGTARTYDIPGTWWASPNYQRLASKTDVGDPRNSPYDLGGDGVELMHLTKHSCIIIVMRCKDLPPEMESSRQFVKMVMCICGPNAPSCMDAYWKCLGEGLADLAKGVTVVPATYDPVSRMVKPGDPFVDKGYIAGLYADAPMATKFLYSVGCFTAYMACMYCCLTAVRIGNVNRYTGYCGPVTCCCGPGEGKQFQLGVRDQDRQYNSATMMAMINKAQELNELGLKAVDLLAFHGRSPLIDYLPYQDIRTLHVYPFVHAVLQGIFKDFLKAIFAPFKSNKAKKKAGGIIDLERPTKARRAGQQQHATATAAARAGRNSAAAVAGNSSSAAAAAAAGLEAPRSGSTQQATTAAAGPGSRPRRGLTKRQQQQQLQQQEQGGSSTPGPTGAAEAADSTAAEVPAAAGEADDPAGALPRSKLVPALQRRIMQQRAAGWKLGLHPDKNRPYRDVVKYHRGLQMEELQHNLLGLLLPIFYRPHTKANGEKVEMLPDKHVWAAFGHLVQIAVFNLTEQKFSDQSDLERKAKLLRRRHILPLGKLFEQDLDPDKPAEQRSSALCRFNLHGLACRLTYQITVRGQTCQHMELWLEREMGGSTLRTKNRIHSEPEQLVVATRSEESALQRAGVELDFSYNPAISSNETADSGSKSCGRLASWHTLCNRYSATAQTPSGAAGTAAGARLEGNGTPMPEAEWRSIQAAVKRSMQLNDLWTEAWEAAWQQRQQQSTQQQPAQQQHPQQQQQPPQPAAQERQSAQQLPAQRQQQQQHQIQQQQQTPGQQSQEQQQGLIATKFKAAVLSDGHRSKSVEYRLSQTRDGTNVLVYYAKPSGDLEPQIGQVQYYLQLQCSTGTEHSNTEAHRTPASAARQDTAAQQGGGIGQEDDVQAHSNGSAGKGNSSSSSSSSVAATVNFAVMKHYRPASRPVTQWDESQVAEVLVEAREDDFVSSPAAPNGVMFVVPLENIHAPVHAHRGDNGHTARLTFVPLLGRSKRVVCNRPG